MNRLLPVLLAALLPFGLQDAAAHGSTKPEHGGRVQMVGETVFELVTLDAGVELYLREEDEALPTAGMTGKLVITLEDGSKSEVPVAPAGGNKLSAKGLKIPLGAKVFVLLVRADQSKLNATFRLR